VAAALVRRKRNDDRRATPRREDTQAVLQYRTSTVAGPPQPGLFYSEDLGARFAKSRSALKPDEGSRRGSEAENESGRSARGCSAARTPDSCHPV